MKGKIARVPTDVERPSEVDDTARHGPLRVIDSGGEPVKDQPPTFVSRIAMRSAKSRRSCSVPWMVAVRCPRENGDLENLFTAGVPHQQRGGPKISASRSESINASASVRIQPSAHRTQSRRIAASAYCHSGVRFRLAMAESYEEWMAQLADGSAQNWPPIPTTYLRTCRHPASPEKHHPRLGAELSRSQCERCVQSEAMFSARSCKAPGRTKTGFVLLISA